MAGRYRGPLHGIPIGLKDNYDTVGVPTRNGSHVFTGRMPQQDATVWARLRDAGAILLGKTTMSEAAWGVDFPPVRNAWDVRRNPGLSSGGSGTAVAAGLCFLAMGSDTGGSIRIPAGLSGVVGLKPTYGRVSRAGIMPHTWSLDHAGPLVRRVEDAALALGVIAGHDARDVASAAIPVSDYTTSLGRGVRGMRIRVPREHFWDRIEDRVETVVRQAVRELEAAGAQVSPVSIPSMASALGAILVTEMACVTAWHDAYLRRPEQRARYTPEVRALLDAGKFIFATDFLKAQRLRRVLAAEVRAAFETVHVLATPTLPLCAWEVSQSHVEIAAQPEHVLHACWRFTYPWNLTVRDLHSATPKHAECQKSERGGVAQLSGNGLLTVGASVCSLTRGCQREHAGAPKPHANVPGALFAVGRERESERRRESMPPRQGGADAVLPARPRLAPAARRRRLRDRRTLVRHSALRGAHARRQRRLPDGRHHHADARVHRRPPLRPPGGARGVEERDRTQQAPTKDAGCATS